MPRRSRIIRVFVSSTFKDMEPERNWLQVHAFKDLVVYCQQRGWQFQAVDLRWGIPDEAAVDQKTISLCLKEIQRCQGLSPRPNFLILLGDRYGWCPPPAEIPQHEFEALVPFIPAEHKQLISFWYKLDENALSKSPGGTIGGTYELLPRRSKRAQWADYQAWEPVEQELRRVLLDAAKKAGIAGSAIIKYRTSATHQEIIEGTFKNPSAQEHVSCFVRRPTGDTPADLVEADFTKREMLSTLKLDLRTVLGENYHEYPADVGSVETRKSSIMWLDEHVRVTLQVVIDGEMAKEPQRTPLELENEEHLAFAEDRARVFVGREDILAQIQAYVASDARAPFWVLGAPGSGKSALLAKAIETITKINPDYITIPRFLGTTALSSSSVKLLPYLYQAIMSRPGVSEKKDKDEKASSTDIPAEYTRLAPFMSKFLHGITIERSLVLVLDAVDQLPANDPGRDLQWLPDALAPNLHIILSIATDATDLEKMLQRRFGHVIHDLPLLGTQDGDRVIDQLLSEAGRALQLHQRAELVAKFSRVGLPLYLRLIFEIARQWNSYDPPATNVLAPTVEGAIGQFLDMVSANHVSGLVDRVLGYIACGRHGLSEQEIIDIVSSDKDYFEGIFLANVHHALSEQRLPWIAWARLYADLEAFLTRRGSSGATTLVVFHRQFGNAIVQKFLGDGRATTRHATIARYFLGQADWFGKPGRSAVNGRKMVELVHQLARAGMYEDRDRLLANIGFLEAKCIAGMVDDAIEDYLTFLNTDIARELPRRRDIEQIAKFITSQAHILRKEPGLFLQQAINQGEFPEIEAIAWSLVVNSNRPVIHWCNKSASSDPCILTMAGHSGQVHAVAFSPDGKKIVSGSEDNSLKLWDTRTGSELCMMTGHSHWVNTVAFSPDGAIIASGSVDSKVKLWDAHTGIELRTLGGDLDSIFSVSKSVESVAFSPDGSTLVSGSNDKTLKLWDARTGKELRTLLGHSRDVTSCSFSPDGSTIVSGSWDKTVRLWDARTGKQLRKMKGHSGCVRSVAFSPDGTSIASASGTSVTLWDIRTSKQLRKMKGHLDWVNSVVFSPDSSTIVSGSSDKTVKLWDARTGKELLALAGHSGCVWSIAFSSDGKAIASGSLDNNVRLWDTRTDKELPRMKEYSGRVNTVTFSPDGTTIASGSSNGAVRLWEVTTGKELRTLTWHSGWVNKVAFSPDGAMIISASSMTVKLSDIQTGKQLHKMAVRSDWVRAFALSRDSASIALASGTAVKQWNIRTGKQQNIMKGNSLNVKAIAFSPDGTLIALASGTVVKLWETTSGTELHTLEGHFGSVWSVAFSPDGTTLASGSDDGTVRLWNARAGKEVHVLAGHSGCVRSVVFSPDGTTVVAVDYPTSFRPELYTIKIWEVGSGNKMHTLAAHSKEINAVEFSPDGTIIASGSEDRTLKLWDLRTGSCIVTYYARGSINAVRFNAGGKIAAGDERGFVHILDVLNFRCT